MSGIRVVSNRTIIKKIIVGTPILTSRSINIQTTIANILDVNAPDAKDGDVLIYREDTKIWEASNYLNLQRIDAGEGF
jgi:propanediol utilization protein